MWTFILTEKCDWKCDYCLFPKISSPRSTTVDILSKHLPYIKKLIKLTDPGYQNIIIEGGEIGFLSIDVLIYLVNQLKLKIDVSTNGEFIRRGYHKNQFLRFWIDNILLHIADEIFDYKLNLDYSLNSDIFINVGIVDIRSNPKNIRSFILRNSDVSFNFIDVETPIFGEINNLTPEIYKIIYDNVSDLPNVTEVAKDRLLRRYKRNKKINISNNQALCRKLNPSIFIDFVNERICLCNRNYNIAYLDLNEANLIYVLTNISPFEKFKYSCISCFRICQDIGVNIKRLSNKNRIRSILKNEKLL
jgi:hypothetical protein